MKAHVISLRSSARRTLALDRAANSGLSLQFFDAVDASQYSALDALHAAAAPAFDARYSRPQTRGELACLISHQRLYAELAREVAAYHLILEDDFLPLADATELEKIVLAMQTLGADAVILGYSKVDDEEEKAIDLSNPLMDAHPVMNTGRRIGYRCSETTCGALSYLCNRRFLEHVSRDQDYGRLADDWSYHKKLGLSIMHVLPLMFREDYVAMTSSLEPDRARNNARRNIRLPLLLRPLWRRGWGVLRKLQYRIGKVF